MPESCGYGCVCRFTSKTKEGYNAHLVEMKRLTPEPSIYVCVCGDKFETKEGYNAHFAEVEQMETRILLSHRNNMVWWREERVTVEEIKILTDVCSGKWLMQFVVYRQ